MVGMSMVIPFLPFYIRDLGVTDPAELQKWSGLIFSGPFIVSFLITPVWGSFGDKYGKKKMVLRAIIGLALSQLLIGLAQNVEQLFIFRIIQGFVSGFIAASLALVVSSTPKERSGYAIGVLQTSIMSGTIIGPMIGGVLADLTNHRTVFFITSGMCFISAGLIYFLVKEPAVPDSHVPHSVRDNIRYVLKLPMIRTAMITILLVQTSITLAQPIFALFIESLSTDTKYIASLSGAIFGTLGVFTIISSPWWGKRNDRGGFRKNLMLAIGGAGTAFLLYAFVNNPYQLFPIRAFQGFCLDGIIPVFYAYINKNIHAERKGGVMGLASSSTLLGNLLGPLITTSLSYYVSNRYIFLISAILLYGNAALVYFAIKEPPRTSNEIITNEHKEITLNKETTRVSLPQKLKEKFSSAFEKSDNRDEI